jgi:predicted permease
VRIDGEALLVALVLVMGCALLFGIAPALQLSGSKDADALRDSSRGLSEGQGRVRVRSALVVAEIALACVLLVSAGLLMRSFFTLLNVDLGFQPAQRVSWRVETNRRFETLTERARFYLRLIERVKEIPGVESAGLTDTLPLGRNREWGAGAKGVVYRENEAPSIYPRMVSPGYLDAMGIRIRKGRDFTTSDNADSRRVIIINQAAERAIFPGQDALGKILINNNEWLVVGVVDDVRHSSVEQNAGAEVYFPIMQMGDWGATDLVVRSTLPLAALNAPMRVALREMDSQMPVDEFQTLGAVVDRAVSPRRFVLYLLGAFAFTAVLLASLGIYGLISYSVSRRATEIGIRMALGASPQHVRKQILRHTLTLGFVGIILGTIGALIVSRLMASLLFGVSSTDVATFAGAIALLFLVAATAGFLPARRASRIEPRIALQEG